MSGGKTGRVGDEERTGEGREVAVDDGELGVSLLSLSERKRCCVDCHTLTTWDQTGGGMRALFGVVVHGGSGENGAEYMASGDDSDSSRFANVEDTERTESAIAPGCWVRCGWTAVDADEDRFRLTDGVDSNDPIIG